MARNIKVTPADLKRAAREIEGLSNDYKNLYDALYQRTEEMGSRWKGKDNTAFITRIAGFEDDLNKMKLLMDDYVTFLDQSAVQYENTQQAITDAANKLTN